MLWLGIKLCLILPITYRQESHNLCWEYVVKKATLCRSLVLTGEGRWRLGEGMEQPFTAQNSLFIGVFEEKMKGEGYF